MHLQSPVVHVQAEVAHFDADCCISNAAVRIMGSLGNRIPSGRKRFFDKVGWILPAVPLSKREAEDDFKQGNTVCNDEAVDVRWAVSQVLAQFSMESLSPYLDIIDTWAATTRSKFHRFGHLSHCSVYRGSASSCDVEGCRMTDEG